MTSPPASAPMPISVFIEVQTAAPSRNPAKKARGQGETLDPGATRLPSAQTTRTRATGRAEGGPLGVGQSFGPRYHIIKEKIYCPPSIIHSVVDAAESLFRGRAIDTGDGLRVEDRGGWVQIRISATEPMIRVIAEDRSKERTRAKADEILHEIELLIR